MQPEVFVRRSRWWLSIVVLPPLAAIILGVTAPDPSGHWVEHLTGAGLKATQMAVVTALVIVIGPRRIPIALLIAIAVCVVGMFIQALGDYRVADVLWRTPGEPHLPGFDAAHELTMNGDTIVLVGGLAFAVLAGALRSITLRMMLLAVVMVVIPPPFFWPAMGVLVVLLANVLSGRHLQRRPAALAS